MNELVDIYMRARFGKAAAASPQYSLAQMSADPKLRALRDQIERSMSSERQLRGEAGAAAQYAHGLATTPRSSMGSALDAVRAALPGASINPAVGAGTHAALGAGGALAGETAQRMLTPASVIARKLENLANRPALAAKLKKAPGLLTRMPLIGRLFGGGGDWRDALTTLAGDYPGKAKGRLSGLAKFIGRRGGAITGALAGIAIPTMMNYSRTKKLRSVGGMPGVRAVSAARTRIQKAEMLRRWRSAQLAGLGSGSTQDIPYPDFLSHAPNVDVNQAMQPVAAPPSGP